MSFAYEYMNYFQNLLDVDTIDIDDEDTKNLNGGKIDENEVKDENVNTNKDEVKDVNTNKDKDENTNEDEVKDENTNTDKTNENTNTDKTNENTDTNETNDEINTNSQNLSEIPTTILELPPSPEIEEKLENTDIKTIHDQPESLDQYFVKSEDLVNLSGGKSKKKSKSKKPKQLFASSVDSDKHSENENSENENIKPKSSDQQISSTANKISAFKTKCFYAQFDEREFNFIQSIDDNPYSIVTFTKEPIQIDMSHQPPKINLTNKGHVINTTEYFVNPETDKNFKPDDYRDLDKLEHVDTRAEYNHLLNSYHNKLVYTNSRSNILTDNQNFIKSIKFLISQPSQTHISEYSTFIKQFLETAANLRRHAESIKYFVKTSDTNSLKPEEFANLKNKRIDKYDLFIIPRDIIELINHVSYYFKDIKNTLKLNDTTGYYELMVKNEKTGKDQAIPILCKHTFMTLNGDSLYTISNECAFKGVCRFCGDTLESVSFEDTTTLPRNVAEFTYMLMELYGCSPDDQSVFIYIYNNVAALISQMVEKDDQNFDNKASSIAALFCYNVIVNHPPIIKPSSFLLLLSETLALVGFNEQKIKSTIESGVLGDTKNIYDVLIDTHESTFYDFEQIFNKYASKDIKDLKAKGDDQMLIFNEMYKQLRIDNLKLDEIVKGFKEKQRELEKGAIEPTRFNTIIVFEGYIKKSCPSNNNLNHDFKNGKCSKCGINSDFKNYEEIYNKYETQFNISYDLKVENKYNVPKYEKVDIMPIIKKNPTEAKEKIIRKFNISQNDFQILCQHIIDDMSIIIPTLQTWTYSNYDKWTVDEILNMIVYLNNDALYEMLWWQHINSSQFIIVNAEDIDANDIDDDD